MDLSSIMDPYVGQKNLCAEICGKDCPQRHTLQMQKFPHLLEKSPFSSDIYGKEFLQRHAAQVQPAIYSDIYLKDFMPHPNLHIASHLVEKTFHPELYAKDFSPIHSMLTQRMTPSLEKAMLNSDIYSKEYLQRHHNSTSNQKISSHLSEKAVYSDRHQKEYAQQMTMSQSPRTHSLLTEKISSCERSQTPCSSWRVAQWSNKPYQPELYNKELYNKELYNKEYMQRLGMPLPKSSNMSEKPTINNIYAKDFSLKPGSQASSIHTANNSTFHNNYNKDCIQRLNLHSQMIKVSPRTNNNNEVYHKDSFPEQYSQTTFQQVFPTQEKLAENKIQTNEEVSSSPNISTHSPSDLQTQKLSHRLQQANEKSSHHDAYNNRSFSQQRPIPQVPFSKIQESAQRNMFRGEITLNTVSTRSGNEAQIQNGKPAQANEIYRSNRPPSTGVHIQTQMAPHIPTNIVRPFRANENQGNSYPSRPDNVASPEKPLQDADNCRANQSSCEDSPSPNLMNLDEKPPYETEINSDEESISKDDLNLQLDLEDEDEDQKPNFNVPYYNRCPTPHSCNLDSLESPVDDKPFFDSNDEFRCQKSALSASTTKLKHRRKPRSSQGQTFQCDICLKHFAQRYYLRIHNRIHTGEKPFHCDLCPKRFVRRDSLKIHLRSHTGEKPFQCDICLKQFAQRHYLQIHERAHTEDKPYKCGICSKRFAQRNYMHVHQKTHMCSKQYECNVCDQQFSQKDYLQVHLRTHTREKPFDCDLCFEKFDRCDTLLDHQRVHTGERPFQCNFCHKTFAQSGKLETHVQIHMRYKPHQCDICQKQFARRYYLHIHKRCHSGEKPFECDQCHKQFAQKYYLQIHLRTHTGEKPYNCELCPKQFARRDTLQIHIRTHTGERPFECNVCGQRFAQRDKLQIHQRIHSGERPFACEFCPKRFSQQNTLQLHRRIHTGEKPYKCEVCSRRFAQRNYLVMHARTHSGEKPFDCDHCGQKFARRDTLQIHRRTHAASLQFPCDLCDKKFSQYDKMRQHKQLEHNTLTAIHNQNDEEETPDTPSPVSPKVEDDKEEDSCKPIDEFPSVASYLWQL